MCEVCDSPLPPESTRRRRFCSTRCKNKAQIPLRAAYAATHREVARSANRRYATRNPEKVAAQMRAYYEANPERFAAARLRRRMREQTAITYEVSDRDWKRLVTRYGGRCAYCKAISPLTRDHIVPISRGGQHAIGNLIPACRPCNGSKGARLLIEWRTRLAA